MRLFVGIDLDEASRRAIHREQQRVAKALEGSRVSLRWVDPERMHITLAFLGEIPEPDLPKIVSAVSAELEMTAFTVVFGQLGVFPERGAPRALWLGVGQGARELSELQSDIARRLQAVGIALESRPFSAHLTLARWRDSRPSDRRRALALDRPSAIARAVVDHATLYRSDLSSEGPTYTALARATLKACLPS